MKASYRSNLILQLTPILAKLGFTSRDVVLSQFGVDEDTIGGTITETTARRLSGAIDEALIELADHFNLSVPDDLRPESKMTGPSESDTKRIWGNGDKYRLFISHTASNATLAAEFKKRLEPWYIAGFVAHEDIEPTKQWEVELHTALQTMDGVLALLTKDFHASLWTDQEIGCAVGRNLPIIPVTVDELPYGFMGKIQTLKLSKIEKTKLGQEVCLRLNGHPMARERMASSMVEMFEKTRSFANASIDLQMLEQNEALTPKLLQRVFAATLWNNQIISSRGVPDRLLALFRKHQFVPDAAAAAAYYEEKRNTLTSNWQDAWIERLNKLA